jgi:hypothetical protein
MELGNNAENRKLTLLPNEENCFAHIGKNAKNYVCNNVRFHFGNNVKKIIKYLSS